MMKINIVREGVFKLFPGSVHVNESEIIRPLLLLLILILILWLTVSRFHRNSSDIPPALGDTKVPL